MGNCKSAPVAPDMLPVYCIRNPKLLPEHIELIRSSWAQIIDGTDSYRDALQRKQDAERAAQQLAGGSQDVVYEGKTRTGGQYRTTDNAGAGSGSGTATAGAASTKTKTGDGSSSAVTGDDDGNGGSSNSFSPIVFLFDTFYEHLFTIAPGVRPLFKNSIKVQGKALVQMIGVAVNKLDQLDALVPALKSLAERHVGYGVKIPHYAIVGENLLFTLKHCMGDALWDAPETPYATAWLTAFSVMMAVMVPAHHAAEQKAEKDAEKAAQAAARGGKGSASPGGSGSGSFGGGSSVYGGSPISSKHPNSPLRSNSGSTSNYNGGSGSAGGGIGPASSSNSQGSPVPSSMSIVPPSQSHSQQSQQQQAVPAGHPGLTSEQLALGPSACPALPAGFDLAAAMARAGAASSSMEASNDAVKEVMHAISAAANAAPHSPSSPQSAWGASNDNGGSSTGVVDARKLDSIPKRHSAGSMQTDLAPVPEEPPSPTASSSSSAHHDQQAPGQPLPVVPGGVPLPG